MAQYEVEAPDGKIHVIEGPDDATPQDIEAFASQTIKVEEPKKTPDKQTPVQSALASFTNMVPGGADAFGALGAAVYGGDAPGTFGEKQAAAKQLLVDAAENSYEQNPKSSIAGMVAGGIAPALLIPAKALQGGSLAHRAVKGAGVAGAYGAAYGAGQGNTVDDRITNAITTGVMAAPFGAGGSLAADAISAAAPRIQSALGPLAARAQRILSGGSKSLAQQGRNTAPQATLTTGAAPQSPLGMGLLDNAQEALKQPVDPSVSGSGIPLSVGQATQNPKQQALEYGAQAGIYGDDAQRMAMEARDLQSQAAKTALGGPSEMAAQDSAQNIQNTLRGAYKSAKAQTNKAYGDVGEATTKEPLKIAGSYVRETVFPSIKDWLRKGDNGIGFDLNADGWTEAKRLYKQAETVGNAEKLTAMNFARLEFWRSKVTNRMAKTIDPAEKKFLGGMLERYDRSMNQLPREAIKSGDDAIVGMMEKARQSRKEQGILFERSKLVKDIVQNDDLTSEQLANTLTSLGPKTGIYVRDILKAGAKNPQMKEALRQDIKTAILGNVLNKSLSAEVRGGSNVGNVEKMVSFDKLETNLGKLLRNPTLLKQIVPEEAERKSLQETYRQVQLIKSTKPGSKNYSNTAYTLLNFVRSISPALEKATLPLVGSAGGGLERWGQGAASLEVQNALSPILKGISDEMTGPVINLGKKYGKQALIGGAVDMGIRNAPITREYGNTGYEGPPPYVDLPTLGEQ